MVSNAAGSTLFPIALLIILGFCCKKFDPGQSMSKDEEGIGHEKARDKRKLGSKSKAFVPSGLSSGKTGKLSMFEA